MLISLVAAAVIPPETNEPVGYLAPVPGKPVAGVLVLHPWWGLNADVKATCNELAKAGYVAFAPDLFEGKTANTEQQAEQLVQQNQSREKQISALIGESAAYLDKLAGKKEIGVIGFSFGAYYALKYSNQAPDRVRATVIYYGTGAEDFQNAKSSYLGHFAEQDPFEPADSVASLLGLLKGSHRKAEFFTYPGTGHWFAEPGVVKAYNKSAADLAWSRTVNFLKQEFPSH